MYKLTPRMEQHFEGDLQSYHARFHEGRCLGEALKELLVRAIRADTNAQHHLIWKEGRHDDKADITVRDENGTEHFIKVKAGEITKDKINLSGHRLGRFKGDFDKITDYLNNRTAEIIAVPYKKTEDPTGCHHIYQMGYINPNHLHGLHPKKWVKHRQQFKQTNKKGVEFSLRPTMSWQIWWHIPLAKVNFTRKMTIT